jgi:anti-sigma factor RsiW
MQVDGHQEIRHIIDRSLAGALSSQEEQALHQHLHTCIACQEYLNASRQAITALGGFSFEMNPELQGKVLAALTQRAQQLETRRVEQKPMLWSYLAAALVLTIAGSFAAAQLSGLASSVFHLEPAQLHVGLVALWIVPSLCFCLLFPILHRLSAAWMSEKGLSQ